MAVSIGKVSKEFPQMFSRRCTSVISALAFSMIVGAHCVAQGDQPQEIKSFADLVRLEPPELRAEKITKLAEGGMVLAEETLPEAFDLLQSGKALNNYMDSTPEPLTVTRLEALERLLGSEKDEAARFRAAALLFRYGRQSGGSHLEKLLEDQHDFRAAEAFAYAREEKHAQAIVEAIVAVPDGGKLHVFTQLEEWDNAELRTALAQAAAQPGAKQRFLMMALGGPSGREMQQAVERVFGRSADDTTEKATAAAALLRISPNAEGAREYLLQNLERIATPEQSWTRLFLIDSVRATADRTFSPALVDVVRRAAMTWEGESHQEVQRRKEIVIHALNALLALDSELSDEVVQLSVALFGNSADPRLVSVYLRSGNPMARTLAELRLGQVETARISQIVELKPLPKELLPRESRQWMWFD